MIKILKSKVKFLLFFIMFWLYFVVNASFEEKIINWEDIYLNDGDNFINNFVEGNNVVFIWICWSGAWCAKDNKDVKKFNKLWDGFHIKCENWKIVEIYNNYNKKWTGSLDKVFISYWKNYSFTSWFVTAKCKPILNPDVIFEDKTSINYSVVVSSKDNPFETFYLSTPDSPQIDSNQIKQKFLPGKDADNQPTFVDILYLQLKIISNLSDAISTLKSDIKFASLFNSNKDYESYEKWLDKFSKYYTKDQFVDAFSGAITLKDIWIATDVIRWLYSCLIKIKNWSSCEGVIKISHDISNKFDLYTLKEVENKIYTWTDNILENSIKYYSWLKGVCGSINVPEDSFLDNQVKKICNRLISQSVDNTNPSLFDLWYSLWVRVKNLETIKNNISNSWFNLNWVYNIFWELNNLSLGTVKLVNISKVKEVDNISDKYKFLRKVIEKDLKDANDLKIIDPERIAILKTAYKILTKDNVLSEEVSSLKPNIDLLNKDEYSVVFNKENIGVKVKDTFLSLTLNLKYDLEKFIKNIGNAVWSFPKFFKF